MTLPFLRANDPKEKDGNYNVYYDLILEMTCHHSHHILFIRNKPLNPVHTLELSSTSWKTGCQRIYGHALKQPQIYGPASQGIDLGLRQSYGCLILQTVASSMIRALEFMGHHSQRKKGVVGENSPRMLCVYFRPQNNSYKLWVLLDSDTLPINNRTHFFQFLQ